MYNSLRSRFYIIVPLDRRSCLCITKYGRARDRGHGHLPGDRRRAGQRDRRRDRGLARPEGPARGPADLAAAQLGGADRVVAVRADVVPHDLAVAHLEGVDHLGGHHLAGDAGVAKAAVQPDRHHEPVALVDELQRLGVGGVDDLEVVLERSPDRGLAAMDLPEHHHLHLGFGRVELDQRVQVVRVVGVVGLPHHIDRLARHRRSLSRAHIELLAHRSR